MNVSAAFPKNIAETKSALSVLPSRRPENCQGYQSYALYCTETPSARFLVVVVVIISTMVALRIQRYTKCSYAAVLDKLNSKSRRSTLHMVKIGCQLIISLYLKG